MKYAAWLSLTAALCAAGSGDATAQGRTRATLNIYASVPMSDPDYIRKGNVMLSKLQRCGIEGQTDETRNLPDLAPNLYVVFSGPHRSAQDARAALGKAAACGVEGYTRSTRRTGD
jgi:hypothetical protein